MKIAERRKNEKRQGEQNYGKVDLKSRESTEVSINGASHT